MAKLPSWFYSTPSPKLSKNADNILRLRYLKRDKKGNIIESPQELFFRVASTIAGADSRYSENGPVEKTAKAFFQAFCRLELVPASPILMNAGISGQLFSDYVLPIDDSLDSIFETLKRAAIIHQSGSGCGFSFSNVRPKNDPVAGQPNVAFGPITVMKFFEVAISAIKQGGRRPGANMAVLDVTHPDILEFISCKNQGGLKNFNISVGITDEFMQAVKSNKQYFLVHPKTKKKVSSLSARHVFEHLVENTWKVGDPGVLFLDEMNRYHPIPQEVATTGSCGQVPMLSYEAVPYCHINLSKLVNGRKINVAKLRELTHLGVHLLDNCIDLNTYPFDEVKKVCEQNRKIGLGIMGFAQMLTKMGISYNSEQALRVIDQIMKIVQTESRKASAVLAKIRGLPTNYSVSTWKNKRFPIRNLAITTVAPTGTTSFIADTSSGIEPIFGLCYAGKTAEGQEYIQMQSDFESYAKKYKLPKDVLRKVAYLGSIQHMTEIPSPMKKIFITTLDIDYRWHLRIQSQFQKYIDSSISKTINMEKTATIDDMTNAFTLAHKMKCKGVTIYRDASRDDQILELKRGQMRLSSFR